MQSLIGFGRQLSGVGGVEHARVARLDEISIRARGVGAGECRVLHAVELDGAHRCNLAHVERVGHVVELLRDARERLGAAVDGKRLFLLELHEVLKFQKPSHMVGVAVGVEHLVNAPHVLANALMAQVGGRVDEKRLLAFDHSPAISAPRARIRPRLLARGAVAEKRGHAAACSRAHKGERVVFHRSLFSPYAIRRRLYPARHAKLPLSGKEVSRQSIGNSYNP